MYKKITKPFDYKFNIKHSGLYSISISASCRSGAILGLFGGEDLRLEIDGIKLREVPAKDKPQYMEEQAQDGNRRPWITLALIDLPLNLIDASVKCEKRFLDSDDVKLIIDGQTRKNTQSGQWGKNWYWQGRQLCGNTEEARFYPNLK
ncbi:MAG: hypothetical protein Q8N21_02415 [bacterium]|nr:hypothetical protein [bacterium]